MVEVQYRKVKENAETYPYIRASYIVVCGGYGHWMTYRLGKLRRTESRIQALQEKLQKLVEAEKSATVSASSFSEKATELPLSAWSVVTADPAASKAPKPDKF